MGRKLSDSTRKKISESLKAYMREHGHSRRGLPGALHTSRTKEKIKKSLIRYYENHPKNIWTKEQKIKLNREAVHRSRAKKKGLLPEDANIKLIREFYLNTPVGYVVDHIIPFAKHGQHHQDNLQYLTLTDNLRKGIHIPW